MIGGDAAESMGGGVSFPEVRKVSMTLTFAPDRERTSAQLESAIREQLVDMPGIRTSFATGGPGDRLTMAFAGRDSETLAVASRELAASIRTVPGIGTVTTSAALLRPEIVIRPDPARAADLVCRRSTSPMRPVSPPAVM